MYVPHPGDLRHKIDIGVTTNVVNENGYPVETDSVLHHVWAGVEDESSRWFHAADADNAERGLHHPLPSGHRARDVDSLERRKAAHYQNR